MSEQFSTKVNRESHNVLALAQDLGGGRLEWVSRPTEVEFGFNNHCNLVCVMCHQADGIPSLQMAAPKAREVLAEVLPHALHLTPSDASEPLMNDLDEVARLCAKYDVQLMMYCNATLLTPEAFAKIAPHTHRIWFSIDSPEKETFEQLRAGSDFDQVIENIRWALPRALEMGIDVAFNAVVMEPNWHLMPELVDFIADLGGTEVALQELLPNSTGYEELKIEGVVDDEVYGAMVEGVKQRAEARNMNVSLHLHPPFNGELRHRPADPQTKSPLATIREVHMDSLAEMHPGFCAMAMNYVKITPDGKVYPCCRGPEELEMGNVLNESFEEIWNGEKYQEFRRKMYSADYPEVCSTCLVLTGPARFPGLKAEADDA